MFIGHFGTGFAGKKVASQTSLGTLFLATQFIDLLWPAFLLLGIERVEIDPGNTVVTPLNFIYYPFSHSLFGVVIWGLLLGSIYYVIKNNYRNAIWVGLLVISHWVLDLFTHRPDLLLFPWSSEMVGLGLWNSLAGTLIVECLIFAVGVFFYLSVTQAKNWKGKYGFWGLIVFLVIIYLSNILGPPPPSVESLPYVGFAQWILIAWGYWVDRNRENKRLSATIDGLPYMKKRI
jgi:hypothetical protein